MKAIFRRLQFRYSSSDMRAPAWRGSGIRLPAKVIRLGKALLISTLRNSHLPTELREIDRERGDPRPAQPAVSTKLFFESGSWNL